MAVQLSDEFQGWVAEGAPGRWHGGCPLNCLEQNSRVCYCAAGGGGLTRSGAKVVQEHLGTRGLTVVFASMASGGGRRVALVFRR